MGGWPPTAGWEGGSEGSEVAERIEGQGMVRLKGNDKTESLRGTELATNRQGHKRGEWRGVGQGRPRRRSWKVTAKRESEKAGKAGWVGGHQPSKKQKMLPQLIVSYLFPPKNITIRVPY